MDIAKREAPSSPAWISPTDMLCSDDHRGGSTCRALVAGLIGIACLHPSSASAEGFGPFPVRNFNPLQQLVLNMPGDRAAVLEPGALDVRLELAETAAIYSEAPPGATASVKFETLRNGLFCAMARPASSRSLSKCRCCTGTRVSCRGRLKPSSERQPAYRRRARRSATSATPIAFHAMGNRSSVEPRERSDSVTARSRRSISC